MPEKTIRELNAEFLAHRNESDRRHNELGSKIRDVEKALESKVSYKHFYWVIGILISILISICSYTAITTTQTKEDVALVKGRLEPYNIEYK